jgi:predicted nucleotide-binding protein
MNVTRRVYVSLPADRWLPKSMNDLKWAIVEEIENLDWQTDFISGRSILAQIEEAASRCNAGIFLFTKDDDLVDKGQPDVSAPRDNVVFEAGYFIGLKGKRNVLIVREKGSKMPADLGGDIYALLPDKVDIGPIERVVSGFMAAL